MGVLLLFKRFLFPTAEFVSRNEKSSGHDPAGSISKTHGVWTIHDPAHDIKITLSECNIREHKYVHRCLRTSRTAHGTGKNLIHAHEQTEKDIEACELEIARLEELMADPQTYKGPDAAQKLSR